MEPSQGSMDWAGLGMTLVGGLALFLFGMQHLTEGLNRAAGSGMKRLLARLTKTPATGLATGALVTAVIQSSSVTTVLVVGFISAGLMTFPQSIGVILGANVGTTVTAQIIAFKVTQYGLLMVAVGALLELGSRRPLWRQWGMAGLGLGLVFLGMNLMSDAARPLRDYGPFLDAMQHLRNPLAGFLVGMVFTALVQSSSATTGLIIVMGGQGLVPLESGIAMILGANVGTCFTAVLSTVGRPREALQAALAHVIFNLAGALAWLGFIPSLAVWARFLSPAHPDLLGVARLAAETPRQIANAHTCFNLVNALVFLGLSGALARLVTWLAPSREPLDTPGAPIYLDDLYLSTPSLALDRVRLELGHVAVCLRSLVEGSLATVVRGADRDLDKLKAGDDPIDHLHTAVVGFLARLSRMELNDPHPRAVQLLLSIANDLENIGDVVEGGLVAVGRERLEGHLEFSGHTRAQLEPLHQACMGALARVADALKDGDSRQAAEVVASKKAAYGLAGGAAQHLAGRLAVSAPHRVETFRLESELVEHYRRVFYLTRRLAKTIIRLMQVLPPDLPPASEGGGSSRAPDRLPGVEPKGRKTESGAKDLAGGGDGP